MAERGDDEAADTRTAPNEDPPLLSNEDLARVFFEIADILEVKGENRFKVLAYRRGAEEIAHTTMPLAAAYREGAPPRIAGIGSAIADKLTELATTGRLRYHDRLRAEVPASLLELLALPGIGPRTVKDLWERLGIATLEDLEAAAKAGKLRDVKGMGARTEERVLEGLASLERRTPRMRMGEALERVDRLVSALDGTPGVERLVPAGSFRRRRETVGDLDLLAETDDPAPLVVRFTTMPGVDSVIQHGGHKAAVRMLRGPQVDLMVMPRGQAGSYLVHFTGSAEHNVRLRQLARDRGWSLSELGFQRIGDDGKPLTGAAAELRTFATEEEVYEFLDLAWIPPEIREDRGEIAAAAAHSLPELVRAEDLNGDCHSHSDWSDGNLPIEAIAEAMRARGYAYQVLTDHTQSLTIAGGLDARRFEAQRRIVGELNERFERERANGTAPEGTNPDGFRLLHGCELEIRIDGRLDFDDAVLARFDVVVASLHVGRRQPRAQLMERYFTAIRSPHVDIISHPSGRKIGIRPDLDLDWEALFAEAARTGTLLEVNGSDERLDLDDRRTKAAKAAGCRFTIDSDAHYRAELDNVLFGVDVARRGWLEAQDVMNTRGLDELLAWVAGKVDRL
jgi:DNA polymerase (family 10)